MQGLPSVPAKHISEGAVPLLSCVLPELPYALPDLHSVLPDLFKKIKNSKNKKNCTLNGNCCFCVFRQLMNCKFFHICMFSSITHKIVPRSRFVRVLDCARILVVRALNCAQFCVVCALNCAQILVVRALDCAQFLLHPALFPT